MHQNSSPLAELSFLCTKCGNVFKDELGTVSAHNATLQVNSEAALKFHKTRPVPFAVKEAVGAEIDRLECEGILKRWTIVFGLLQYLQILRKIVNVVFVGTTKYL